LNEQQQLRPILNRPRKASLKTAEDFVQMGAKAKRAAIRDAQAHTSLRFE
jgi:hypothetical protein